MTATLFADALASKGIGVYEVRPGIIATDMTAAVKEKYDRLIAGGLVPQGRWGFPEDVGRAVAALARGDFGFLDRGRDRGQRRHEHPPPLTPAPVRFLQSRAACGTLGHERREK